MQWRAMSKKQKASCITFAAMIAKMMVGRRAKQCTQTVLSANNVVIIIYINIQGFIPKHFEEHSSLITHSSENTRTPLKFEIVKWSRVCVLWGGGGTAQWIIIYLGSDPDGALLCDKISMQYLFSKSFTYFIESFATLPVLSHFPSIA